MIINGVNFRTVFFSLLLIAAAFLFATSLSGIRSTAGENDKESAAKSEDGSGAKPIIATQADKTVKEMSETLGSAKEFSFEADISYDELLPTGQKIQYGGTIKGMVRRPDGVYAEYDGDYEGRKIWYDGKQVTVLDTDNNFYGQLAVPAGIDDTMDFLINDYGFTLPLADIISADPYSSLMGNVSAGVVVGDSTIKGLECSHLAFVEKYIDWQLWVSKGEEPIPCKLVITYKVIPGAPQYTAVFSNWDLKPDASEAAFKAEIPDGAVKINFMSLKEQRRGNQ